MAENLSVKRLAARPPDNLRLEAPELPPLPDDVARRFPSLVEWVGKLNEWKSKIRLVGNVTSGSGGQA